MDLIKLSLDRATKLSENLSAISERAGVTGYLVGLVQDAKRCIELNLKNDPDNDQGDAKMIAEIIESLSSVEQSLSIFMATAVTRSGK